MKLPATRGWMALLAAAALLSAPLSQVAFAEEPATAPAETTDEAAEAPADAPAEEAGFPWETDYAVAQARAKAEGKDLFINFTGSDWCGWCIKLDEEVFSQGDFAEKASKKFVFVFMDKPNAPELQAKVVDKAVRDDLMKKYGVRGFPSIRITSADGLLYGRTGYQAGGPDAYLTHLNELHAAGAKIKTFAKLNAESATLEDLKAGVPALEEAGLLGDEAFCWVMPKIESLDADGSHGLLVFAQRDKEEKAMNAAIPKGPSDTPDWEKLHEIIKTSKHLGESRMFLNVSIAVIKEHLMGGGHYEEAIALANKTKALPSAKKMPQAAVFIDGLLAEIEKAKTAAAEEEMEETEEVVEEDIEEEEEAPAEEATK